MDTVSVPPAWRKFEYQCVDDYRTRYGGKAVHWDQCTTELLLESGYIKSVAEGRRARLGARMADGRFREFGLDGIGQRPDGRYDGIQSKRWLKGSLGVDALSTYRTAIEAMQGSDAGNGGVLYHASGGKVTKAAATLVNRPDSHWRVHALVAPPCAEDCGRVPKEVEVSPWAHEIDYTPTASQARSLEQLREHACDNGLVILAQPCGSGKTYVIAKHVADQQFPVVVVAAPLIASAEQALQRIMPFVPGHAAVAFWSGSCGIPGARSTLNEDTLVSSLEAGPVLVCTTYDSASRVYSALLRAGKAGSGTCFVADEAHNLVDQSGAHDLAFKDAGDRVVILATATPPRSLREMVEGLDKAFVIRYSMRDAIEKGEVLDYTITLPLVEDIGGHMPVELKALDTRAAAGSDGGKGWDAIGRAMFHAGGMMHDGARRSIVYLRSSAECAAYETAFAQVCDQYLGVACWVRRITCDVSGAERRVILREFEEDECGQQTCLKCITSIRVLDEAVDSRRCDSVFIADLAGTPSERSHTRILQRLSRATRIDPSRPDAKAHAYFWTGDSGRDDMAALVSVLSDNDPQLPSRVRVRSSDYDRAVGDASKAKLCHLALEKWVKDFAVNGLYTPRGFTDSKVSWLIQHYPTVKPESGAKITTDLNGRQVHFNAALFLEFIRDNWREGKVPNTQLTDEQKHKLIGGCSWMSDTVHAWENCRIRMSFRPSVDQRIDWLTSLYAAVRPKALERVQVCTPDGTQCTFPVGPWVQMIRENWGGGVPKTILTVVQKDRIAASCAWAATAIEEWVAHNHAAYNVSTDEKLELFIKHCAVAKPVQSLTVLAQRRDGRTFDFRVGSFFSNIRSNWIGGVQNGCVLTDKQKARVETACSWLKPHCEETSNVIRSAYRPTAAEKAEWLILHCASQRPPPAVEIAVKSTTGEPYMFQAGHWLQNIKVHWMDPDDDILSDALKRRLVEGCPWMEQAVSQWMAKAMDSSYKPTTEECVAWLTTHYVNRKPTENTRVTIDLVDGRKHVFEADRWLLTVRRNWMDTRSPKGAKLLSDRQKQHIESSCAWMHDLVRQWNLPPTRPIRASVQDNVDWLVLHCSTRRPSMAVTVPIQLPDGRMHTFNAGHFVHAIQPNWGSKRAKATKLSKDQMTQIFDGCPWMKAVAEAWRGQAAASAATPTSY